MFTDQETQIHCLVSLPERRTVFLACDCVSFYGIPSSLLFRVNRSLMNEESLPGHSDIGSLL